MEREKLLAAGYEACRKSVYAVCEDISDKSDTADVKTDHEKGFQRGASYTAKSIARGFGALDPTDDNNFLAALAENT